MNRISRASTVDARRTVFKRVGAICALAAVVVLGGLAAVTPITMTRLLGEGVALWIGGGGAANAWDSRLMLVCEIYFVLLLLILACAGLLGRFWARFAGFPRTLTMWITIACVLAHGTLEFFLDS